MKLARNIGFKIERKCPDVSALKFIDKALKPMQNKFPGGYDECIVPFKGEKE